MRPVPPTEGKATHTFGTRQRSTRTATTTHQHIELLPLAYSDSRGQRAESTQTAAAKNAAQLSNQTEWPFDQLKTSENDQHTLTE